MSTTAAALEALAQPIAGAPIDAPAPPSTARPEGAHWRTTMDTKQQPTPPTPTSPPMWRQLADQAIARVNEKLPQGTPATPRVHLDDAACTRLDADVEQELLRAGCLHLREKVLRYAALAAGDVVVSVELPRYQTDPKGLQGEWLWVDLVPVLLADAVRLLVHPEGPVAELARRRMEIAEQQRAENLEQERRAKELRARNEQHNVEMARAARWQSLPEPVRVALLGAEKAPAGSAAREALIALALASLGSTRAIPADREIEQVWEAMAEHRNDPGKIHRKRELARVEALRRAEKLGAEELG